MAEDARKGVGLATLVLMGSVLASRALGLVREALLAARLGTGSEADAYATAFILPDLVNTLLAGGFLSVSFVPLYTRALRERGEREAGRFLGGVLALLGGLGFLGIAALLVWTEPALRIAQPGLAGTPTLARAVELTRILLPAQFAFLLAGAWNGAQYAHRRFLFPALAPLVYNLGILAGGWFLAPVLGAEGFAWGVLAGAMAGHLVLQTVGAWRAGARPNRPGTAQLGDLRAFAWRTLPLMLGLTLSFSAEYLLRRMAGGLGTGAVASASYAFRLAMVLVAFFGQSTGVASYPFLVTLAAENRWEEFQRLLNRTLGTLMAVLVPATAWTIANASGLVRLAYRRGAFDEAAVEGVAQPLRWMALAIFPWCAQMVVSRAYYARDLFWRSAFQGSIAVVAGWVAWDLLVGRFGRAGVGPGLAVLVVLNAVVFLGGWLGAPRGREAFRGLPPLFLESAAVATLAAWAVVRLVRPDGSFPGLVASGVLFAVLLLPWALARDWPGARPAFDRALRKARIRPSA